MPELLDDDVLEVLVVTVPVVSSTRTDIPDVKEMSLDRRQWVSLCRVS